MKVLIMLESLECRRLFSGNVTVVVSDGLLAVVGDAGSNSISLMTPIANDYLIITGRDGTTVNGDSSLHIFTYPNPSQPFDRASIRMGDGDDRVFVYSYPSPEPVSIDLGAGSDRLDFENSDVTSMDVFGGDGNDQIYFRNVSATRRLRIFAGGGADTTGLRNVDVPRGFDLSDSGTKSRIGLIEVNARSSARPSSYIGTGNSRDMVEIADCRFSGLSVRLRGGDDGLFIDRTVWSRPDVSLDADDGGNTIYIDGTTPS